MKTHQALYFKHKSSHLTCSHTPSKGHLHPRNYDLEQNSPWDHTRPGIWCFRARQRGKRRKSSCAAFCCGLLLPYHQVLPQNGRLYEHQSKTSTDARSINMNVPYKQFIWGLAFSNSVNTWKHSDCTYLKVFLSLHTLQVCGTLEIVRPQGQRPCPRPWDQPEGEQTIWSGDSASNSHSLFYRYKGICFFI